MTKVTAQYLPGMQAVNDFYAMLYQAMLSAMPEALSSLSGAYVWRGYRIDSYKTLASCQFYCQLYLHKPEPILLFQECYKYKNKHFYPFRHKLNLLESDFFSKKRDEQLNSLMDFIRSSSERALVWQDSEDRKQTVPHEFLAGKTNHRHKLKEKISFDQVSADFVQAIPMQNELLFLLIAGIQRASQKLFSSQVDLQENANWHNWDYRGYWMKFLDAAGKKPKGASDYVWRIYYKNPEMITCEKYRGNHHPDIPPFQISADFLSASEEEQKERLYQFALQSLQIR